MPEAQKSEAQQILNELFHKHLIPFQLTAHKVECVGLGDYIVLFNDSRLYSVDIVWNQGESFKDAFRVALLDVLERRNSRLREKVGT